MKIAVTGGSGFIGSRLIARLKEGGHQISNIDIADAAPIDILELDDLNNAVQGSDAIFHLAAAHRDDVFPRSIYYDVNVEGTKNVIETAKENNINHIVFASTVAIYGLDAAKADENTPAAPFNDYGRSKWQAEEALREWAQASAARKLTIIRPVVVFGENNRGNVYTLMNQVAKGKFLMIGKGHNKKSMAYVGNVAGFFAHALTQKDAVQIYNYSDKPDLQTKDLIATINASLGKDTPSASLPYPVGLMAGYMFDVAARVTSMKFPVSSVRIKKFCADTTVNADKAHTQSGFRAEYTLKQGIERMIKHEFATSDTTQKKAA